MSKNYLFRMTMDNEKKGRESMGMGMTNNELISKISLTDA